MSEEQLKAFGEAVQADAGLQEELGAAKDAEAVVAIAKGAGFVISAEDLARLQPEVSDAELAGVTGGISSADVSFATVASLFGGASLGAAYLGLWCHDGRRADGGYGWDG